MGLCLMHLVRCALCLIPRASRLVASWTSWARASPFLEMPREYSAVQMMEKAARCVVLACACFAHGDDVDGGLTNSLLWNSFSSSSDCELPDRQVDRATGLQGCLAWPGLGSVSWRASEQCCRGFVNSRVVCLLCTVAAVWLGYIVPWHSGAAQARRIFDNLFSKGLDPSDPPSAKCQVPGARAQGPGARG